jgi:hypothetical protein
VITVSNKQYNVKTGFSILSAVDGDPRRKPGIGNVNCFQSVFQKAIILLLQIMPEWILKKKQTGILKHDYIWSLVDII